MEKLIIIVRKEDGLQVASADTLKLAESIRKNLIGGTFQIILKFL